MIRRQCGVVFQFLYSAEEMQYVKCLKKQVSRLGYEEKI